MDAFHPERVEERRHDALSGDHRVSAEVVGDAEAGEFEDQAPKVPGECRQHSTKVAPAADAGARAVQEQHHRSVVPVIAAVIVVAQSTYRRVDFTKAVLG
ncbi:hypothetical protein MPRG_33770 [Mycobacterium paragordonae]|uniref:Uncharacterized protein n=1 Tax=Mycobacterium paragordonae TaxID=1389713 RepID=A0ABQ1C708_9MYCO|nr:hypothetical protein MPRG_33770 [Mycobacterium paragordonae]